MYRKFLVVFAAALLLASCGSDNKSVLVPLDKPVTAGTSVIPAEDIPIESTSATSAPAETTEGSGSDTGADTGSDTTDKSSDTESGTDSETDTETETGSVSMTETTADTGIEIKTNAPTYIIIGPGEDQPTQQTQKPTPPPPVPTDPGSVTQPMQTGIDPPVSDDTDTSSSAESSSTEEVSDVTQEIPPETGAETGEDPLQSDPPGEQP